jgi:MoaA/NifB/PqqE/SkfB family radical SAM enzyme
MKMTEFDIQKYSPTYCVWELTLACNLRCGHCGSRAGKARPDEMSTEECLGVVRALADLGCEVITLSGGEPTLRKDWYVIAKEIREQGMIPNMVTNGYEMDELLARQFKEAGLSNVAVSIDGPEDIHDQIRGKRTFKRTIESLMKLKNVGISTTVMTTANSLNLSRLAEIHQLAISVGADRWRCQLGKPMGNMKTNSDLVLKPNDLLILLPTLYQLHKQGGIKVGIGDSLGYYGPYDSQLRAYNWKGQAQHWGGCQAGMRAIGIEANGGIKGCLSMQAFGGGADPFLEGNIRTRSLKSIWQDPSAFAYNRQFSPDDLTGYCARCRHHRVCRGGAKCVAAAATGSVSEDPYCYFKIAQMATSGPYRKLGRHIATAASVLTLMCAGCAGYDMAEEPAPDVNCEEVCCDCDYGEMPADIYNACCEVTAPDYGVDPVDPCAEVCCDCDYGDPPPPSECCAAPEYGVEPDPPPPINCENVCCDCDYGELPPEVAEQCCENVVTPDYGVEPDPPINCTEVCCDCDYGVEPDIPPPINCENVCCDCDYGILPDEVIKECCEEEEP